MRKLISLILCILIQHACYSMEVCSKAEGCFYLNEKKLHHVEIIKRQQDYLLYYVYKKGNTFSISYENKEEAYKQFIISTDTLIKTYKSKYYSFMEAMEYYRFGV